MEEITKRYIEVAENPSGTTHLKVELGYSKGSYYAYKVVGRGYYVSVSPVERDGMWESYVAFTGVKSLVKEVQRKSKKAEAEALKLLDAESERLIDYVLKEENLQLAENSKAVV